MNETVCEWGTDLHLSWFSLPRQVMRDPCPGNSLGPKEAEGETHTQTAPSAPTSHCPGLAGSRRNGLGHSLIYLPENSHKHQAWLLPQKTKISDRKVIPIKKTT